MEKPCSELNVAELSLNVFPFTQTRKILVRKQIFVRNALLRYRMFLHLRAWKKLLRSSVFVATFPCLCPVSLTSSFSAQCLELVIKGRANLLLVHC